VQKYKEKNEILSVFGSFDDFYEITKRKEKSSQVRRLIGCDYKSFIYNGFVRNCFL